MKFTLAFITSVAALAPIPIDADSPIRTPTRIVLPTEIPENPHPACCTQTYTLMPPCPTGKPGTECPQYMPPREPCTLISRHTVTVAPRPTPVAGPDGLHASLVCGGQGIVTETVTGSCGGFVCPVPCATVTETVTVEACATADVA